MDLFASDLSFPYRYGTTPKSGALVRDKIASEGGEFSRHITITEHIHPLMRCKHFTYELEELAIFPEQFER